MFSKKNSNVFQFDIYHIFNLIRNFAPPPQPVHRTSEPPPSQFKLSITGLPLSVTTQTIRYDQSFLRSKLFHFIPIDFMFRNQHLKIFKMLF